MNSFKADKGTRLATYAARCVENEILMYFRNQKKTSQDISMSEPIDTDPEGNPLTLSETIYTDDTVCDDIYQKMKIEKLKKYISEMPDDREKAILIKHYGLNGCFPKTQKEIAKELKISRSYVSRIEKKVLEDIRNYFDENDCV